MSDKTIFESASNNVAKVRHNNHQSGKSLHL